MVSGHRLALDSFRVDLSVILLILMRTSSFISFAPRCETMRRRRYGASQSSYQHCVPRTVTCGLTVPGGDYQRINQPGGRGREGPRGNCIRSVRANKPMRGNTHTHTQ